MLELPLILRVFILVNPLSSVPVLADAERQEVGAMGVAWRSVALAYGVALAFVLAGPALFALYGISVDSFRAAGGLLVLLLGLSMARDTKDEGSTSSTPTDALVSLIATPLLTGPATLSYLIIQAARIGVVAAALNLTVAFVLVALVFMAAAWGIRRVNLTYIQFVSRLLGLFLIALGIEMLVRGTTALVAATAQ